jgi:hypothetical protein
MNLIDLAARPFGACVTWHDFAKLVAQADSVCVCFYAVQADPKLIPVGRAMPVEKEAALQRARDGAAWNPAEQVNVSAAGNTLYFGAR